MNNHQIVLRVHTGSEYTVSYDENTQRVIKRTNPPSDNQHFYIGTYNPKDLELEEKEKMLHAKYAVQEEGKRVIKTKFICDVADLEELLQDNISPGRVIVGWREEMGQILTRNNIFLRQVKEVIA